MNFIDRNRELGRLEAALKGYKSKKIVYALFLREKPLSTADCEIMLPEDVLNNLPK